MSRSAPTLPHLCRARAERDGSRFQWVTSARRHHQARRRSTCGTVDRRTAQVAAVRETWTRTAATEFRLVGNARHLSNLLSAGLPSGLVDGGNAAAFRLSLAGGLVDGGN